MSFKYYKTNEEPNEETNDENEEQQQKTEPYGWICTWDYPEEDVSEPLDCIGGGNNIKEASTCKIIGKWFLDVPIPYKHAWFEVTFDNSSIYNTIEDIQRNITFDFYNESKEKLHSVPLSPTRYKNYLKDNENTIIIKLNEVSDNVSTPGVGAIEVRLNPTEDNSNIVMSQSLTGKLDISKHEFVYLVINTNELTDEVTRSIRLKRIVLKWTRLDTYTIIERQQDEEHNHLPVGSTFNFIAKSYDEYGRPISRTSRCSQSIDVVEEQEGEDEPRIASLCTESNLGVRADYYLAINHPKYIKLLPALEKEENTEGWEEEEEQSLIIDTGEEETGETGEEEGEGEEGETTTSTNKYETWFYKIPGSSNISTNIDILNESLDKNNNVEHLSVDFYVRAFRRGKGDLYYRSSAEYSDEPVGPDETKKFKIYSCYFQAIPTIEMLPKYDGTFSKYDGSLSKYIVYIQYSDNYSYDDQSWTSVISVRARPRSDHPWYLTDYKGDVEINNKEGSTTPQYSQKYENEWNAYKWNKPLENKGERTYGKVTLGVKTFPTGVDYYDYTLEFFHLESNLYENSSQTFDVRVTKGDLKKIVTTPVRLPDKEEYTYPDTVKLRLAPEVTKEVATYNTSGEPVYLYHGTTDSIPNNEGITVKRGDTVLQKDGDGLYIDNPPGSDENNKIEYTIDFEGNSWLKPFSTTYTLKYYHEVTHFAENNTQTIHYPADNSLTVYLQDSNNVGLSGKEVKIYRNYTLMETTTTDNNGKISYTDNTLQSNGGSYTYKFRFEGDTAYKSSGVNVERTYMATSTLTFIGSYTSFSSTGTATVDVELTNGAGEVLKNKSINVTISDSTGDELGTQTITTQNDGMATATYTTSNPNGSLIFDFEFAGSTYMTGSTLSATVEFDRTRTEIIADDVVKVYNGRYTNIYGKENEIDWTTTSPGVDTNYKTFHAKLQPINSSEGYINLPGSVLKYKYNGTVKFEAEIDENGEASARWTSLYTNTTEHTFTLQIVFEGNDLYKPATKEITYHVIPRIQPVLTPSYETIEEYGGPIRYKIPFLINAKLTETTEDGTPIGNQNIVLVYKGTKLGTYKTNKTTGIMSKQQIPDSVGVAETAFAFDMTYNKTTGAWETDEYSITNKPDKMSAGNIDKYFPVKTESSVTIDKDYTLLTIATGAKKYTSCGNALVKFLLTDSIGRPIGSNRIKFWYDNGTYYDEKWLTFYDVEHVTTDAEGNATYSAEAYSGIRKVKGLSTETWCYYATESIGKIEYDISRTLTATVNDGIASIPVDCILSQTKGLPNGLYDVQLEYIPPTTESGECPLYGTSTNLQPMRKKYSMYLFCMTEPLTATTFEPFFVETELDDYNEEPMWDMTETSKVNNKNKKTHTTDNFGRVWRGAVGTDVNGDMDYHFQAEQTRDYSGAVLDVTAKTTKIQPILEVASEITGYAGVEIKLEARLYYEYKKYDAYGYEIKKDSSGVWLFYDSTYDIYYKRISGVRINISESEYNEASSIIKKVPIADKIVRWGNTDGKERPQAKTDSKGYATAQYITDKGSIKMIYASTDEDSNYFSCAERTELTVLSRIQPYFTELDENLPSVIYNHNSALFARLCYMEDGVEVPFKKQTVYLEYNGSVNELRTDNDGYVNLEIVALNEGNIIYKARFEGYNQYDSASKTYTIPINKQIPTIALLPFSTTVTYSDEITLVSILCEDDYTTPIPNATLTFYEGNNENAVEISSVRTDNNGKVSIKHVCRTADPNRPFMVKYDGANSSHYGDATKTININVKKIGTRFESSVGDTLELPGATSQTATVVLKDAKNNPMPLTKVQVTYGGETVTYTSNAVGEIKVDTGGIGEQNKDTTKQMSFNYSGDNNHERAETFNLTVKWGEYLDTDDCKNIDNFDVLFENWYASDGSTKWGIDVAETEYRRYTCYKNNKSPIYYYYPSGNPHPLKLRETCNDLRTKDNLDYEELYDNDEDRVSAPTGVVLRNNKLYTSKDCYVQFYFKVKYNGVSDKTYVINGKSYNVSNQFGGHFGLMRKDAITGEKAPVRFEFYRGNAYMILEGGKAHGSELRYSLAANTEYKVRFDVKNKNVTITMYKMDGTRVQPPQQWSGDVYLDNLYPYVFAFTNGTSFVMRELKIVKN